MTYIIAEVGSSHGGSLGNALQAVRVFADLGANALKFQDHYGQEPADDEHPPWFAGCRWAETRQQYLWSTGLTADEWAAVARWCGECDVEYVCSPFSVGAARRQAPLVDCWKIASGQVTNLAMLEVIAASGKPVILSCGLANEAEVARAVSELGGCNVRLLACSSLYPCPDEFANVRAVQGGYDGLSDHTEGLAACLGAVALGAAILEKHVTLSRRLYGTDTLHAMEPEEFGQLVREVRALGRMLAHRDEKRYRELTADTRRVFLEGA